MVCPVCYDAIGLHAASALAEVEVSTIQDLEPFASTCKFCRILLSLVKEAHPELVKTIRVAEDHGNRATKGIGLVINYHDTYQQKRYSVCNLRVLDETGCVQVCASGLTNTGSDAAAAWTKEKLKLCTDSHKECNLRRDVLPDRVLQIASHDSSETDEWLESDIRLVVSGHEQLPYATLSHRWGEQQPLCLVHANLADFQRKISWSCLPKTFQHSVTFARKLGLKYIWIDSLCIIQDSKEDWLEQSGKMAEIYENSTITLAASTAEGGTAGMFADPSDNLKGYVTNGQMRIPAQGQDAQINELLAKASADDVIVFVKETLVRDHEFPARWSSQSGLPLLDRGWVYQERILSPRVLHHAEIDLIWECHSHMDCYCKCYRPIGSRNPIARPVKSLYGPCASQAHRPSLGALATAWTLLVVDYTSKKLTYSSDRHIAIAGVAKQFQQSLSNKNYLAGLWEETLLTDLTWIRTASGPRTTPETPSLGPSWSWMSVPGPIGFPRSRYMGPSPSNAPTVVDIAFEHKRNLEFTTLWGGSITLRGKLLVVKLRLLQTATGPKYFVFSPGTKGCHSVELDFDPSSHALDEDWKIVHPRWASKPVAHNDSTIYRLTEEEDMQDQLPIGIKEADYVLTLQRNDPLPCLYMGLRMDEGGRTDIFMLLKCRDAKTQLYTRLGIGTCELSSGDGLPFAEADDMTVSIV